MVVRTDHKSISYFKKSKSGHGRLTRWILALQNFEVDIQFIPGRNNVVADLLSRTDYHHDYEIRKHNEFKVCNIMGNEKVYKKLIQDVVNNQKTDQWIQKVKALLTKPDPVIAKYYCEKEGVIFCNKGISKDWKLCVPKSCIEDIIKFFHEAQGHVGSWKVCRYLNEIVYFKAMKKHISKITKCCKLCQLAKDSNERKNLEAHVITAKYRGQKVFIDLFGEIPHGRFHWLLIMVDAHTKFTKLYPMIKANARTIISKIRQYVNNIGPIKNIISDNGTQFTSQAFKHGLAETNIRGNTISIYYPVSNLSERVLKEVGNLLRIYVPESKHNTWYQHVPKIERILNENFHSTTQYKPIEVQQDRKQQHLIFKCVKFPNGNDLHMEEKSKVEANINQRIMAKGILRNRNKIPARENEILKPGTKVIIKNIVLSNKAKRISAKLCKRYKGVYKVIRHVRKNSYLVEKVDKMGKNTLVNQRNIKVFYE